METHCHPFRSLLLRPPPGEGDDSHGLPPGAWLGPVLRAKCCSEQLHQSGVRPVRISPN